MAFIQSDPKVVEKRLCIRWCCAETDHIEGVEFSDMGIRVGFKCSECGHMQDSGNPLEEIEEKLDRLLSFFHLD